MSCSSNIGTISCTCDSSDQIISRSSTFIACIACISCFRPASVSRTVTNAVCIRLLSASRRDISRRTSVTIPVTRFICSFLNPRSVSYARRTSSDLARASETVASSCSSVPTRFCETVARSCSRSRPGFSRLLSVATAGRRRVSSCCLYCAISAACALLRSASDCSAARNAAVSRTCSSACVSRRDSRTFTAAQCIPSSSVTVCLCLAP